MGRGETRITLIDPANDRYEIQVASDEAIVRTYESLVDVAVSEGFHNLLEDTPVAAMSGWQAVVTDGDTGITYSGRITDVSQYGFLLEI